jgi:hypothetical protein
MYVYPLQWLARAPLAACLHRESRLEEALEHWRLMLEDPQQVLPDTLQHAIALALSGRDPASLETVEKEASRFRFV